MLFDFWNRPSHYKRIDSILSRSAQIGKKNIQWLKRDGVTDIISFREAPYPREFNEKELVQACGLRFYRIPTTGFGVRSRDLWKFLTIIKHASKKHNKVHIHCKFGAHRTGLFAYLYERIFNIKTKEKCFEEFDRFSYHYNKYEQTLEWIEKFITRNFKNFK